MPIFNLSNFNYGNGFIGVNDIPTPSTYSNIKIYGQGNFTNLHGQSRVYSQSEIDAVPFDEYSEWDSDTFILAKFNNNLQAGNITSLEAPIDKWIVLRKAEDDAKFTKLAELEADAESYIDRTARSNETYVYDVIPEAGDKLGSALETEAVSTDFTKVVILEPDTLEGYSFCLDLRLSEIRTDEDVSFNGTRGRYPTYQKNNRRSINGTVGFVANSNSVGEEFEQDIEYLRQFEDFITNGSDKLIKFPKGYIYRVKTSNFSKSRKTFNDRNGNSVWVLSFEYTEIGDVEE